MYQSDRGKYKKEDSLMAMFWHSCLGKIVIIAAFLGLMALIAYITCPSEDRVREEMNDNICQCIVHTDSITTDWVDDMVANVGYIFTTADSAVDKNRMALFHRHNRLEFYDHGIYSSLRVYNTFNYDGTCVGIGFFGMVIPVFSSADFLLRVMPMPKESQVGVKKEVVDSILVGDTFDMTFQDIDPTEY